MKVKKRARKNKPTQRSAVQISGHLIQEAKIFAVVEHRSIAKQLEHWAEIGKCAEENPDLPFSMIQRIMLGVKQLDEGQGSEYKFGI